MISIPKHFKGLKAPVISAPLFIVSNRRTVVEQCKNGIIGTIPALNARSTKEFDELLTGIENDLLAFEQKTGVTPAVYGVNLIVHKTNARLQKDLEVCIKHKVPLIITSLGAVPDLVDKVHSSYGGIVFHDVIKPRHAKKAADAGVDGIICVCAGAGGHSGTTSPFALIKEVREFFDGTIILGGAINTGQDVASALLLGADMAYMGTRFICTKESPAPQGYKDMIVDTNSSGIIYTPGISGVNGNFMIDSITNAGLDLKSLISGTKPKENIGDWEKMRDGKTESMSRLPPASKRKMNFSGKKAWKDIWSAGHGAGGIHDIPTTKELCQRVIEEYNNSLIVLAKKQNDFRASQHQKLVAKL